MAYFLNWQKLSVTIATMFQLSHGIYIIHGKYIYLPSLYPNDEFIEDNPQSYYQIENDATFYFSLLLICEGILILYAAHKKQNWITYVLIILTILCISLNVYLYPSQFKFVHYGHFGIKESFDSKDDIQNSIDFIKVVNDYYYCEYQDFPFHLSSFLYDGTCTLEYNHSILRKLKIFLSIYWMINWTIFYNFISALIVLIAKCICCFWNFGCKIKEKQKQKDD